METIIGKKYEVLGELGRGGMGVVYRVRHRELGRIFACKVLDPGLVQRHPELVGRFHHEARVMARLRHPNIVQVFDIDRDADQHYFVMEYVEGRGLDRVLAERGALPLTEVTAIGTHVARALGYAHSCDPAVVHRDIKPANILIEDNTRRVVVTDFGIAKLLDDQLTRHTSVGAFIGTLRYSSPEQVRGDADLDERADIYALGMLMYEMTVGRAFFAGLADRQLIGKLLYDKTENLVRIDGEVPDEFCRILSKAIAKDRTRRYPSAAALLADLEKLDLSPTLALTTVLATHLPRRRPYPVRATLAGVLVLLATTSGLWFWTRPHLPEPAHDAAPVPQTPTPVPADSPASAQPSLATKRSPEATEPPRPTHDAAPVPETPAPAPVDSPAPAQPPLATKRSPEATELPKPAPALRVSPADAQVALDECRTQTFAVQSGPPEAQYAWWVDAQLRNETGTHLDFTDARPGHHEVRVEATGAAGTARHTWEIEVRATAATQAQVRQWLDAYSRALQNKQIPKLRALGFIHRGTEAEALRKTLEPRQKYQVSIHNIQTETLEGEVSLSFRQMDSWYDPATYSTVVDHTAHRVTLVRVGCADIAAR